MFDLFLFVKFQNLIPFLSFHAHTFLLILLISVESIILEVSTDHNFCFILEFFLITYLYYLLIFEFLNFDPQQSC